MSEYGNSKLSYNEYLKVPELLRLQKCLSDPPSHDELHFIIIHQTYELWFKLMLFELDSIVEMLFAGDVRASLWLFRRVSEITRVLITQFHVMETMSPADFLEFRGNLNPASGFQSVQFREVEFAAGLRDTAILKHLIGDEESLARLKKRLERPSLRNAFLTVLAAAGFDTSDDRLREELARLHRERLLHHDLYLLAEALIEFDEGIQIWRFHHVRMVERMIGNKQGTGGSEGVRYLNTTLEKKFFPELWDMRTLLVKD